MVAKQGKTGIPENELRVYVDKAWIVFRYHKDQQNKILYWGGGVFTLIAGATNLFGITGNIEGDITFLQVYIMHLVFVLAFCFFLHHRLYANAYRMTAEKGEKVLLSKPGDKKSEKLLDLFRVRNELASIKCKFGYWNMLLILGNIFIVVVYSSLSIYPIFYGEVGEEGISIKYITLKYVVLMAAPVATAFAVYVMHKRHVIENLDEEWKDIYLLENEE